MLPFKEWRHQPGIKFHCLFYHVFKSSERILEGELNKEVISIILSSMKNPERADSL